MKHHHSLSTSRIETFSDAVIAIIVTLLVLELKVPELGDHASSKATARALLDIGPEFVSFALSFFIICIFWVNHHQFFQALKRVDRKILWMNIILLFWLCVIPFPTAFLGRYPTNTVAAMVFGTVLFLAAVSFSAMSYYAMFASNLFEEHVNLTERKRAQQSSYWGIFLYALSIILAPLSAYISLAIFLIVPLIYFVPRRITYISE